MEKRAQSNTNADIQDANAAMYAYELNRSKPIGHLWVQMTRTSLHSIVTRSTRELLHSPPTSCVRLITSTTFDHFTVSAETISYSPAPFPESPCLLPPALFLLPTKPSTLLSKIRSLALAFHALRLFTWRRPTVHRRWSAGGEIIDPLDARDKYGKAAREG